jgi:hypothetical protein
MSLALYLSRVRSNEVLDRMPLRGEHVFRNGVAPRAPASGFELLEPFVASRRRQFSTAKWTVRDSQNLCGWVADEAVLIEQGGPINSLVSSAAERTFRHRRLYVRLRSHLLAAVLPDYLRFSGDDECERHFRSNG